MHPTLLPGASALPACPRAGQDRLPLTPTTVCEKSRPPPTHTPLSGVLRLLPPLCAPGAGCSPSPGRAGWWLPGRRRPWCLPWCSAAGVCSTTAGSGSRRGNSKSSSQAAAAAATGSSSSRGWAGHWMGGSRAACLPAQGTCPGPPLGPLFVVLTHPRWGSRFDKVALLPPTCRTPAPPLLDCALSQHFSHCE